MKFVISLDDVDFALLCATLIRAEELSIAPRCSLDVIKENTAIVQDEDEG